MANWIYAGADSYGIMEFIDTDSLLVAMVHDSNEGINLYKDGVRLSSVSSDAYTQFMFESGLGNAVVASKARTEAEVILKQVVDAIRASDGSKEAILEAMKGLNPFVYENPYYGYYLLNALKCNDLWQSGHYEWTWGDGNIRVNYEIPYQYDYPL